MYRQVNELHPNPFIENTHHNYNTDKYSSSERRIILTAFGHHFLSTITIFSVNAWPYVNSKTAAPCRSQGISTGLIVEVQDMWDTYRHAIIAFLLLSVDEIIGGEGLKKLGDFMGIVRAKTGDKAARNRGQRHAPSRGRGGSRGP